MMTSLYDGVETESYRITLNHFALTFYTVDIQHQTLESVIISLDKATYRVSCVILADCSFTSATSFRLRVCASLTDLPDLGTSSSILCFHSFNCRVSPLLLFTVNLSLPQYDFQLTSTLHRQCFLTSLWRAASTLESAVFFDSVVQKDNGARGPDHQHVWASTLHQTPDTNSCLWERCTGIHLCSRPYMRFVFIIAVSPVRRSTFKLPKELIDPDATDRDFDIFLLMMKVCLHSSTDTVYRRRIPPCCLLYNPDAFLITPQRLKVPHSSTLNGKNVLLLHFLHYYVSRFLMAGLSHPTN